MKKVSWCQSIKQRSTLISNNLTDLLFESYCPSILPILDSREKLPLFPCADELTRQH